MNTKKIVSFRLIKPLLGKKSDFHVEEAKKYLQKLPNEFKSNEKI